MSTPERQTHCPFCRRELIEGCYTVVDFGPKGIWSVCDTCFERGQEAEYTDNEDEE